MSTEIIPAQKAVEIDWYAEEEMVKVVPRDQQRFDIHKDHAIRILQLASDGDKQLSLLFNILSVWTRDHSSQVCMSYLTLRGDRFGFFAISRTAKFDDELEDAVTELDYEIANDPALETVDLNAMVLPPASSDSLNSFFDDRFLLVFRGERS